MKLKDIGQLGLSRKTFDEIEVDPSDLIRADEFNRPNSKGDYRENSIDRLIKLGISFHSDCNTIYTFARRFIVVFCPHCNSKMEVVIGSGNGDNYTITYRCPILSCNAVGFITLPAKGISFSKEK